MKALSSKDYSRAIKLLNLSLQFPNNSAEMCYLVNNSLATAYFETKQYIKAVEKGRECFKFKPTKSQVHGQVHFNSFCGVLNRDDQCKVSFIWSGTL